MNKFCCPTCGSENIQSVPLVFEAGTSTSSGFAHSTALGANIKDLGNPAVGKVFTEFWSKKATLTAARMSPPLKKTGEQPMGCGCFYIFGALLGVLLVTSSLAESNRVLLAEGLIFLIGFGGLAFYFILKLRNAKREADEFNREIYPKLLATWQSSWFCHKCGFIGLLSKVDMN